MGGRGGHYMEGGPPGLMDPSQRYRQAYGGPGVNSYPHAPPPGPMVPPGGPPPPGWGAPGHPPQGYPPQGPQYGWRGPGHPPDRRWN
jgi:CCR4-NOT transcriptional complex subunit CAF120